MKVLLYAIKGDRTYLILDYNRMKFRIGGETKEYVNNIRR